MRVAGVELFVVVCVLVAAIVFFGVVIMLRTDVQV
jgi:hypothetical protein